MHDTYNPLQYPLLFSYGEYGWHNNIMHADLIQHTGTSQYFEELNVSDSDSDVVESEQLQVTQGSGDS